MSNTCPQLPCPPLPVCPGIVCCPPDPFIYQIPLHAFCNKEQCAVALLPDGCEGCQVIIPACTYFSDVSQQDADAQAFAAAQEQATAQCNQNPTIFYSAEQCVNCQSVDNGSDPVLGPPYPPFFFQATGEYNFSNGTAHLMWTLPELTLDVTVTQDVGNFVNYDFQITNFSWPEWDVINYIQNQRVTRLGIRYYSLVENNYNNPPESSPTKWAIDDTFLQLYRWNAMPQTWTLVQDSNNSLGAGGTWSWSTMTFHIHTTHGIPHINTWYISSTANSIVTYSPEFQSDDQFGI